MSGILERIEARLEAIEAQLAELVAQTHVVAPTVDELAVADLPTPTMDDARAELEKANDTMEKSPAPTVEEKAESVESPVADVELDSDGVPFNIEIHSGKPTDTPEKRQNVKGQWKMRRGGDRAAYDAWRESHKAGGAAPTPQPEVQATPPSTPPPVVDTGATPPPSSPTLSAPPSAPEQVNPRQGVLKEINELTQTYGVQHTQIDDVFVKHGSDTLDGIPQGNLAALETELKGWADYLELCQSLIDDAETLDTRIAKTGHGGIHDGCGIIMKNFNGNGSNVGTVPKEAISGFHDALKAHVGQWETWAKGEGL